MFGHEGFGIFLVAAFPGCVLLCLLFLRRYHWLVRATIGIGLLGVLLAFWALLAGRVEVLATSLLTAALGLGLAAVASSQEVK